MSKIYETLKTCIWKDPKSEEVEIITAADDVKENTEVTEEESTDYLSDKKTDEVSDPSKQPGYLWRMSSGIYSTATGAVGLGVGGIKWVAGKSYDVGTVVVSKVPSIPRPKLRHKDKDE